MLIGACHLFVCADLGVLVLQFRGFESNASLLPFPSFSPIILSISPVNNERNNVTYSRASLMSSSSTSLVTVMPNLSTYRV